MASNDKSILDGDGRSSDWIEIYNSGDMPLDLAGYHLTNNATDLEQWTFPSIGLDPGQFLVVFASAPVDGQGKLLDNYVDAGGSLHTNFVLDASGQYLALVEPDGTTIVNEFAPAYPPQRTDIAYGSEQQATFHTLVGPGANGKMLIPDAVANRSIGTTWTGGQERFADSTWRDVITGIGYDDAPGPRFELTNVALNKSVTQSTDGFGFFGNLAVDGNRNGNSISHTNTGDFSPWLEINLGQPFLIERIDVYTRDNCCTTGSPERDYNLVVEVKDENDIVVFTGSPFNPWDGMGGAALNVGNGASFTVDLTGEVIGGIEGQKVRVSKQAFGGNSHSEWLHLAEVEVIAEAEVSATEENFALNKPTTGDVAFNRPTSNGVDGNVGNFTHSENVGPVFWQVDLEMPRDVGRIEIVNRGDGCCPERLNGAVVSVMDSDQGVLFTANPIANAGVGETIVFDNGGAGFRGAQFIRIEHNNQYLSIAELRALPPVDYGVFIGTGIETEMKDINASAYLRVPFGVADATSFDQLTLGMHVDDGFVAYLNGTEIARYHAPAGTPSYDAAATDEQPGASFEQFVVAASLLSNGVNILAIHGLNLAASDDDFLILPQLTARETPTGDVGYLIDPTPGQPNAISFAGFVADTRFDVDRGFYDEPFDVNITSPTPGTSIVYTTDGSPPTATHGVVVPASDDSHAPTAIVHIESTTTLRAAAFKEGLVPTNVDTQTYIFLEDVIQQPSNPVGLPVVWDGIAQSPIPADYGMDPEVVNDPAYRDEIIEGLRSIPTISIVMDPEDIFGQDRGIYINSGQRGREWEHPTSVEIIEPDGATFQVNAGIRIHGFSWRFHSNSPKHGFRLEFRDEYGPEKLNYPLFPDSPVEQFDSIVLRQQGGRAWAGNQVPQQAQYLRDTFARDLAREMGATDGHATLVHLYLNGLYWGLYNPVERPDAQMAEEYFGGSDEDYDALNRRTSTTEAIDGDLVRYNELMAIANSALSSGVTTDAQYAELQRYVAMDDFIDWFIRNQYVTNRDGLSAFDGNNQRAIGSRVGDAQFRFFVWDMEYSMWNATDNNNIAPGRNSPALAGSQNPPNHAWTVYNALRQHPEFRLRYADRAHQHLFNDGALTPEKSAATWEVRAESIETAIIAESARWGDARRSTPYTRDVEWEAERNRLLTQYFPQRSDILVSQYRAVGLYPDVAAPTFLINGIAQHGGAIESEAELTLLQSAGIDALWYTLDGTDPRLPGGAVNGPENGGNAQLYAGGLTLETTVNVQVRARKESGEWSALTRAVFVVGSPLAITEIHYNPPGPTPAELAVRSDLDNDDFEFLEVRNVGDTALNVVDIRFIDGIDFTFASHILGAAEHAVIVRDVDAFQMRYGTDIEILGEYAGNLNNGGERITMVDPLGKTILDFTYRDADPWPAVADGIGASLELASPSDIHWSQFSKYYHWRGSSAFGGSPGYSGELAPAVVINEVLTNTDTADASDAIEIFNPPSDPIDIGVCFLSDSANDLLKFQIPAPRVLAAGDYVVFDEGDFNPSPLDPAETDFALDATGDDVWLVIPDGQGGIRSFVDDVHFVAVASGQTMGRVPNGSGRLSPLSRNTLGCGNGHPQVGPIIISEIHYNPGLPSAQALVLDPQITADDLEFIEIHNASLLAMDLTEWRLRGGIEFNFSAGTLLAANSSLVLIPFDPDNLQNAPRLAAFLAHHGMEDNVLVMGGYSGQLNNDGEALRLQRPGQLADTQIVPRELADEVIYDDIRPWQTTADGDGRSLRRAAPVIYGNRGDFWSAGIPTPGWAEFVAQITQDFTGDAGVDADDIDVLFDAVVSGQQITYFDLDGSGAVDIEDVHFLVETVLATHFGDANLDGQVDTMDLGVWNEHRFQACNQGWAMADFNGDGTTDGSDFNLWNDNRFRVAGGEAARDHAFAQIPRVPRPPREPAAVPPGGVADAWDLVKRKSFWRHRRRQ